VSNLHGNALLEFLQEAKMCVLNGRVQPDYDNFTYVSTKGRSVVDYIIVPHSIVKSCNDFRVCLANDIVENEQLTSLLNARCRVPDHSLLQLSLDLGTQTELYPETPDTNGNARKKRFNRKRIPTDFMSSEGDRRLLLSLIDSMEMCREQQASLDNVYKELTETLTGKMKELDPGFDCSIETRRRRRKAKPFWNEELSSLWNEMRAKEKDFLKCKKQNSREWKEKLTSFKTTRKQFDKIFRREERKFKREQMRDIETICSNDPRTFWDQLKKLGPKRVHQIPMEVHDADGRRITKHEDVLSFWANEFAKLYSQTQENSDLLHNVKHRITQSELAFLDPLYETPNTLLNRGITLLEVEQAVQRAKNGKATGQDQIPNEILKFPDVVKTLHSLLSLCFDYRMVPTDWGGAIIHPIHKNRSSDPTIPMNYRGISLSSVIAKLYSGILNQRLIKYLESNNILTDEQCGFRPGRGCDDRLFSLHAVIKKRLEEEQDTFVMFIDFRKAFDLVNRDLMLHKMTQIGIDGHFYFALKALYRKTWAQVRLNDELTEPFITPTGVRQGDSLSPTIFISYLNDLSMKLKDSRQYLEIGDRKLNHLLYADDLALIADSPASLQKLADITSEWCSEWQLSVNTTKTQVMHFRKKRRPRQDMQTINMNGEDLKFVDNYKYLGVTFDEHLTFSTNANILAGAAGRALGALIAKYKTNVNMGYGTYGTLYESCVAPILDYGSHVTGYHIWKELEAVQFRAERVFLGVHKFAAKAAISSDMNWDSCYTRQKFQLLRFWNKLTNMPDHRLPKQIFLTELQRQGHWSAYWRQTLEESGCTSFATREPCDISSCQMNLRQSEWQRRKEEFGTKPKLVLFSQLKENHPELEPFLKLSLSPSERSALSQLRSGTLPLSVETGRYTRTPREQRICPLCENGVETVLHFLFECPRYNDIRDAMTSSVDYSHFQHADVTDHVNHLTYLFETHPRKLAKFVLKCLSSRKAILYL
jgi:hypothetical protein